MCKVKNTHGLRGEVGRHLRRILMFGARLCVVEATMLSTTSVVVLAAALARYAELCGGLAQRITHGVHIQYDAPQLGLQLFQLISVGTLNIGVMVVYMSSCPSNCSWMVRVHFLKYLGRREITNLGSGHDLVSNLEKMTSFCSSPFYRDSTCTSKQPVYVVHILNNLTAATRT